MKLRLRGNSLRLRLSQAEVAQLAATGTVEDRTSFPSGQALTYRVTTVSSLGQLDASMANDAITIRMPANYAKAWPSNPEVGLETLVPLGAGETLRVLVEKDFKCIDPPAHESQEGMYPNPAIAHGPSCTPTDTDD